MIQLMTALGYAFCWGTGVTLTKLALSEIPAPTLLIIQLVASVVFLAIASYLREGQLPNSWQLLLQGRAGVFEPALAYMVGIFGLQLTTASNAVLISSSEVMLTVVLAAIFLQEPLTRLKLLLSGMSGLGVLLLVMQEGSEPGQTSLLGNGLILLGTLFAVLYVLCSKQQIAEAKPLQLTLSQQSVGLMVTVLGFGLLGIFDAGIEVSAVGISGPLWALAIASGIMQYALAFLLYLMALQTLPVSQAAFYIALIPVFGVVSARVLLGEQPSLLQWCGGALVIGTSYWANRLHPHVDG